jgi:hypothetical protein
VSDDLLKHAGHYLFARRATVLRSPSQAGEEMAAFDELVADVEELVAVDGHLLTGRQHRR